MRSARAKPRRARSPQWTHALGSVADLFCGAGGLSHGLHLPVFEIAAGINIDAACRFPFEHNNRGTFVERDVAKLDSREVNALFKTGRRRILTGCAPRQPFSTYNQKNSDPTWQLVTPLGDLAVRVRPDILSMENVPTC